MRRKGFSKGAVFILELFNPQFFLLLTLESFLSKLFNLFFLLLRELLYEDVLLMPHDLFDGPAVLLQTHALLFTFLVFLVELLTSPVSE